MKTYARIHDGRVAEIITTGDDIRAMFHPALVWVDISGVQGVQVGWTFDGAKWAEPVRAEEAAAPLSLSHIQSQLALLTSQISKLAEQHG